MSPIHFGIIMAVNLSIGMYTPPFGLNLFASRYAGISVNRYQILAIVLSGALAGLGGA